MKRLRYLLFLCAGLQLISPVRGQQQGVPGFMNHSLSPEERATVLISLLTPEEKMSQLVFNAPGIGRLGIPAYNWWNESLHGVARAGYATVFPQSVTLAGSWDKDLIHRIAVVISDEARAKHHEMVRRGKRGIYQGLTFWSPNINIFRDPRWGRGHETYGEDPFLTGQLGLQFVRGLQGDHPGTLKTVATAKHFAVHSGPEPLRHVFNATISERDLHETYLPAFRTLVVDGKVASIMGAYNRFRDFPCCANPYLYKILRDDWGFNGYIVSDCGAIRDFYMYQGFSEDAAAASAAALKSGTDLECGSTYASLPEALTKGLISEGDLDVALKRIFSARFKLGMFDPDEKNPYARFPVTAIASDESSALSREAARKSIVLLKNRNNILPLAKGYKTVAVIGPNADNKEALLGNYNGIPRHGVTILEGLKKKLEPAAILVFAEGSHLAEGVHNLQPVPSCYLMTADGKQGITGEYFANSELKGTPAFIKVDDNVDFYWESGSPSGQLPDDDFSIRWSGYLVPPETGTYHIGCWGMPVLNVWLEGEMILSHFSEHHAFHKEKPVYLESGIKYKLIYEYKNHYGDGDARLLWCMPGQGRLEEAVSLAGKADVVVAVLGLSQRLEGEEMPVKTDGFSGGDRTSLDLPVVQEDLLKALVSVNKPVILVLLNGSALSVNWANDHVDAILYAGYPGQEGGNAVADVLTGDYNPAGRLPVTWYKSVDQLPPFGEYDMKERTYRYFTGEPLYPFGFGLSYTTFSYTDLLLPEKIAAGEPVPVSVKVTNTGVLQGEEVVQLYLTDVKASSPRPLRQLEGFKRISLNPGESQEVEFFLDPWQLSIINDKDMRVIEPGWFEISAGGIQPGSLAQERSGWVVSKKFRVTGKEYRFGAK